MIDKQSRIVAEMLGEDALAAYLSGGEWEWMPDSIEYGDAWAHQSHNRDDKCVWYQLWFMSGWRISGGKVWHEIHECDTDGRWDFLEDCNVDDPGYQEWEREWFSETERQEGWAKYALYVAETGDDPLGNYFTVEKTRKEEWTAKLIQSTGGIVFVGAHRKSLGYIERVAETDVAKLPRPVRDFLELVDHGDHYRVNQIRHLDELKGDGYKLERSEGYALVTFEIDLAEPEETIIQRKKYVASSHIKVIVKIAEDISDEDREELWDVCVGCYPHAVIDIDSCQMESDEWVMKPGERPQKFAEEVETLRQVIENMDKTGVATVGPIEA